MAPGKKGKIEIFNFTDLDGNEQQIYSKAGDVETYVGGLTPFADFTINTREVTYPGGSRRQYPGGPGINYAGHTKTRLTVTPPTGPALPGQTAYIEVPKGEGLGVNVLNVTFTGSFASLYTFVIANATSDFTLRSPDGTPYDIIGSP